MTYFYIDITDSITGETVRVILFDHVNGVTSFNDVETNNGPERAAYLAWVAEGNEPQPWNPEQ